MLLRETHRIQTKPSAYGFLAGLLVLLLGLVANASCARGARGRDPGIAFESIVRISVTCTDKDGEQYGQRGSGVIVNSTTILTAAHVALDQEGLKCIRSAQMVNGKSYLLMPHKALPDYDLASMKIMFGEFDPTHPVAYGPIPPFGSRVCSMTAFPRVWWRCGEVQAGDDPPGDLFHTILTEGGNSGSGVYDTRGRLIGIITHRVSCVNGQYCGGKMATLQNHVKDLL